jgi:hypothetical protein
MESKGTIDIENAKAIPLVANGKKLGLILFL